MVDRAVRRASFYAGAADDRGSKGGRSGSPARRRALPSQRQCVAQVHGPELSPGDTLPGCGTSPLGGSSCSGLSLFRYFSRRWPRPGSTLARLRRYSCRCRSSRSSAPRCTQRWWMGPAPFLACFVGSPDCHCLSPSRRIESRAGDSLGTQRSDSDLCAGAAEVGRCRRTPAAKTIRP